MQLLKKIRLGQDANQDIDSNPLSLAIQVKMVPSTFRVSKEKFSGTTYPIDHVVAFESHIDLYSMTDAIKCHAFPATFRGVAQSWYDFLPAQSITKFKQFKKLFIEHFMANKRRPKKITSLWSITQGPNKTLESYTKRFTTAYSCVAKLDEDFAIQAYIARLSNESIRFTLCSNDITNMERFIAKAHRLSDAQEMSHCRAFRPQHYENRRVEPDRRVESDRNGRSFSKNKPAYRSESSGQTVRKKFEVYTSLIVGREQILNAIVNESIFKPPHLLRQGPKVDKIRYCSFHKDYGHTMK